jgi:hypothetical protein
MVTWFQQEAVRSRKCDFELPIHIVDICIEVSEYAETLDPKFQRTSEVYSWIISWGTGHHSFGMARELKAEGALPVGSVAVPITRTDHELTSSETSM